MIIELNKLNNAKEIILDDDFTLDLKKYENHEILDLKNLHVTGRIFYNALDLLEFDLTVSGVMLLKDSVTLEEIEYSFNSETEEEYDLNDAFFEESYQKAQNTLDISEILWENIVLEVPIRLTKCHDANLKGDGWSLGDSKNEEEIDPRLAKLNELLGEREE